MALVLKDRVREASVTSGTGTLTLDGAISGFQGFSVIGDGNTTYYAIVDVTTGDWEVGVGTYSSTGPTLSRDSVLESSNSGNLVNFSSNIKDVFCTYPAEQAVTLTDVQTLTNKTISGANNTLSNIGNSSLTNSSITFGSTAQALGSTVSAINGVSIGGTTRAAGSFTTLDASGNVVLGDATSDTISANGRFNTDVVPSTTNARDLGTSSLQWKQVYATTFTEGAFPVVTQTDIGTAPNQIPLNQYLGDLAYQDAANIAGNVGVGGNLNFFGIGNRITGDFSNATLANRVLFKTSTTNGNTLVTAMPNGAGVGANFQLRSYDADLGSNGNFFQLILNENLGTAQLSTNPVGTGTALPMAFAVNSGERMRIDTSGNVGIGTSSPSSFAKLAVLQESGSNAFQVATTTNGAGIYWSLNNSGPQYQWSYGGAYSTGTSDSHPLGFVTSATERMRIDSAGNVGIGTSSPASMLHVSGGEIRVSGVNFPRVLFQRGSSALWEAGPRDTDDFFIRREIGAGNTIIEGGNVGIGTSSPGEKLTVAGTVQSTSGGFKFPDNTVQTTAAVAGGADVQTFDASGTWTKPASGSMARIQVWGGGGGGATANGGGGGGGGGYNEITVPLSTIAATVSVTVGAGGSAGATSTAGGTSSFGSLCFAYGGGGSSGDCGGGGGGQTGTGEDGSTTVGGQPGTPLLTAFYSSTYGLVYQGRGNGDSTSDAGEYGASGFMHGGGGGGNSSGLAPGLPSVWGGGGGACFRGANTSDTGGSSLYGGAGGNNASGQRNGFAPGGGGSGGGSGAGDGAPGRVIVTVW
jgi:hypothetical protein